MKLKDAYAVVRKHIHEKWQTIWTASEKGAQYKKVNASDSKSSRVSPTDEATGGDGYQVQIEQVLFE